jgi:hypothetical protein
MNPSTAARIKRLEARIKSLKEVVAKRNRLFHKLRTHYEKPQTAIGLMRNLLILKLSWQEQGLELMDYLILLALQDRNIFWRDDVDKVIAKNKSFYDNGKHATTRCINRLIEAGYVRDYSKRHIVNYFVTTEGRVFLRESGKLVRKVLRNSLK